MTIHLHLLPVSVSGRAISLALAACLSVAAHAQQSAQPSTTTSEAVPVTTSVDASEGDHIGSAATSPPAKNSVRVLPTDVSPNPPSADELKTANRTWHGEYEADALGVPLLGPDGRVLPVLYDHKGKRVKSVTKVPKSHPIQIVAGTLTVDGWTGKARLNHDIPDLRYIYLSAPGVGTVIVSQAAFKGATEQKDAFKDATLTVTAGEHQMQLTSDKTLLNKRTTAAWVLVDPSYTADPRFPVLGYGSGLTAPYEWPGAKLVAAKSAAAAPPLPTGMTPKLADCASPRCGASKTAVAEAK